MPYGSSDQFLLSKMALTKSGFFQHLLAYCGLSALACLAFEKKSIWLHFMAFVLLGSFLELVQFYLPYRTFNIFDIAANLVGVALGMIFALMVSRKDAKALRAEDRGRMTEGG